MVAIFVAAFLVARGCQDEQVRVSEEQAISIAEERVGFEPDETQIRLLRQGLNSQPFWFVVLSESTRKDPNAFSSIAQFRVNANTGEVAEIAQEEARKLRKRANEQE